MTSLREAAEQVLETCTDAVSGWDSLAPLAVRQAAVESLDALRAAIEQPIPESFNEWWNSDILSENNPFLEDSPAYWAWEGWEAAKSK